MTNAVCLMVPFVVTDARADGGARLLVVRRVEFIEIREDFDDIGAVAARTILVEMQMRFAYRRP